MIKARAYLCLLLGSLLIALWAAGAPFVASLVLTAIVGALGAATLRL